MCLPAHAIVDSVQPNAASFVTYTQIFIRIVHIIENLVVENQTPNYDSNIRAFSGILMLNYE